MIPNAFALISHLWVIFLPAYNVGGDGCDQVDDVVVKLLREAILSVNAKPGNNFFFYLLFWFKGLGLI